jgi:CheY-like chemotaxis protein
MIKLPDVKHFVFKDTSFANLMNKRVLHVLLIATKYDAFMLEDDGRVDEQIFDEYTSLSLRYPPRFTQVTTDAEALEALEELNYDLVICMPNMDHTDIFAVARHIKQSYPAIPLVVLTPFSKEVSRRVSQEDLSAIDYVFSWLGNAELLLAIIKLIEDKMNVEADVASVGVQTILLIEDSVRFYSATLPHLYKFVLRQSQDFSKEALNEHQRTLRMRGRPKILLARSYEEAEEIYYKFKSNMLGIVSDISYPKNGQSYKTAGYEFAKMVRANDRFLPIIFTSSDACNLQYAQELKCDFINKNSKTFPQELRYYIQENFGFGDFKIIDPKTKAIVARIQNLKDLQKMIHTIPDDSLAYHLSHNHFSRFLYSRAMFPVAELLKGIDVGDYKDMDEARSVIFDAIVNYRKMKNTGVVAVYLKDRFDEYSNFARIGEDSLGGKGRGLAFMGQMLKRNAVKTDDIFKNASISIPKTVVLCTDIFDEFMETNNLYAVALQDIPDEQMLKYFLKAALPTRLVEDFTAFFDAVKQPIAIRSSSLLEDSHYQPFAGVYTTYMIPRSDDKYQMLRMLSDAIKAVYASVFYKDSKAYMTATQNLIEQEKMAIVLQEVVGNAHLSSTKNGNRFYPAISGVARSLNFYPIGEEKPEDGIANIALGLGKYIVDGGVTLRFSPRHPHNILQMSDVEIALRETQTQFYALNLDLLKDVQPVTDDAFNLWKLPVKEAEADGVLKYISSTYDHYDQVLLDGFYPGKSRKIISFSGILQHDVFPLSEILDFLLKLGQEEMGRPVEIEFAVNLSDNREDEKSGNFYLLQVRPIVDNKEVMEEDLMKIPANDCLLYSTHALGHGVCSDIQDIVYVKTNGFNASNNPLIAREVEKINSRFMEEEKNYILVGPGRWGSSDYWLGIPVKWPHICYARVIVESGLENYRIEPSQGTHFFQNLTSFGVGYFTINPFLKDGGIFDEAFLNMQPAVFETDFLRHVRFSSPIVVKIDGKKNVGVVLKPD